MHWAIIGKISFHIGNRLKWGVGEWVWFVPHTAVRFEWCNPQKILQFLFSFKLGKFILLFIFLKNWQSDYKLGPLQTYCVWKTLRATLRATFKNAKISLWIGIIWNCSLRTTLKIPVLNLYINWENLCPNLSVIW